MTCTNTNCLSCAVKLLSVYFLIITVKMYFLRDSRAQPQILLCFIFPPLFAYQNRGENAPS